MKKNNLNYGKSIATKKKTEQMRQWEELAAIEKNKNNGCFWKIIVKRTTI